jgi:prevent-host-death family protein
VNNTEHIWSLQDAKAKLSKVIRQMQTDGPQILTVHGKKTAILVPYQESKEDTATGAELVKILENSPLRELRENLFERSAATVKNRQVEF